MKAVALVLLAACGAQVSQDHATGPDGVIEGARPVALVDGDATITGTVSYPSGDRVDWVVVELPAVQGSVEVAMQFTPRAPAQHAMLEVWNDDYVRVDRRGGRKATVVVSTEQLPRHKLYLRVYAPRRSDGGSYTLAVHFTKPIVDDWHPIEIPDPPRLPAVPAVDGCGPFDHCEQPPTEILGRIIKVDVQADATIVWIAVGSDQGLQKTWTGTVLRDDSDQPLPGGVLSLIRVNRRVTTAKVKLTNDQLVANPRVRMSPP